MYALNGSIFDINAWQLVGDNQYPPGWFADADARAAANIVEVFETPAPTVTLAQRAEQDGVAHDEESDIWSIVWHVVDLTSEEIAEQAQILAAKAEMAINQCFADVDAVYGDAIGQRGPEYLDAEAASRAFIAANYQGTPSEFVTGYALHNPTGQAKTNKWAADTIVARADAFEGAKLAMRNTRFACQAAMRAATTDAQLDTAIATWNGFIAGLRAQLGL